MQFQTPAPGATQKFYRDGNTLDEVLDLEGLERKYASTNRKVIPPLKKISTHGYFGSNAIESATSQVARAASTLNKKDIMYVPGGLPGKMGSRDNKSR